MPNHVYFRVGIYNFYRAVTSIKFFIVNCIIATMKYMGTYSLCQTYKVHRVFNWWCATNGRDREAIFIVVNYSFCKKVYR